MNPDTNQTLPDVYASPEDINAIPTAVYVHVPFCLHRCGYCDFTLVARQDELIPAYLAALRHEFSRLHQRYDVDTIFIGGGTPTHLSPTQLQELLDIIAEHFRLNLDGEFSIEANPDGLDCERLKVLRDGGVNRLSLGVQAFDDIVLKTLERQHTAAEAQATVEAVVDFIPNVSLDLIFGVPGQTLDVWQRSVETASQLPLQHVSTYGLTFEKGTDFFSRLQKGALQSVPDQIERDMYALAIGELPQCGYEHYEISNFAAAGHQCRHNLTYWAADEYFAFGPGAARYVNGVRSTNARNVGRWIRSWQNHQLALQDWEQLTDTERTREAIFLGLRRIRGIDIDAFTTRFQISPLDVEPEATLRHIEAGHLINAAGHLRLTSEGRFIADTIIADFL